jgi:hypothetical protein
MFDRLRRCQQTSVECRFAFVFRHDFGALIKDTFDGVTLFSARWFSHKFEDLLETLDLALGLIVMFLESRA